MATYNKFNDFAEQVLKGIHNFDAHTFRVYLSNTTPDASADTIKTELAEIATGNGYTGAVEVEVSLAEAAGTATVSVSTDNVEWTATGGAIAQFRYAVLYNDSATDDPLICWWDYGSAVDLATGEKFKVDFGATLLTLV